MLKDQFRRAIIAAIPLVSVILLLIVYESSVLTYIRCVDNNCEPIPKNLNKVLVPDDPETHEPTPDDSKEDKRGKEIKQHERYAARYGGRVTWLFLRLAYIISCLTAFIVACAVVHRSFADKDKRAIIWVIGVVAVSIGFGILLYNKPDRYMTIFLSLFKITIENDLANITELMIQVNSFGFAVSLSLVLAACAILYSPNSNSAPAGLKQLSAKMKDLQAILYAGTIMLVVGILLIRSVYQWSLAFILRDEQSIKVAETFYSNLLASEGGVFTLMLASVYLPTAFILRRRAGSLNDLPEQNPEREKLLKDYHLTFSFTESLPRLLAILGPLLAGPVGEVFSRLSK
jgi:hypothetical protein